LTNSRCAKATPAVMAPVAVMASGGSLPQVLLQENAGSSASSCGETILGSFDSVDMLARFDASVAALTEELLAARSSEDRMGLESAVRNRCCRMLDEQLGHFFQRSKHREQAADRRREDKIRSAIRIFEIKEQNIVEQASSRRLADRSQLLRAVSFVAARGEEARSELIMHSAFALWSTLVRGEHSRRGVAATTASQHAPTTMQSRMRTPLQSEDAGGKSTIKGARRRVESQENEPPRNDLTRPTVAHFRYSGLPARHLGQAQDLDPTPSALSPSEPLQQQQHFRSLPLASLVDARLAGANTSIPAGQPPTSSRSSSAEPRGGSGQLRPAPSEPVARRHPSRAGSPPPSPHPPPPPSPGQMNQRSTWQQPSLGNRSSGPRGGNSYSEGQPTQPAGTPAPSARPSPRSSPLGRPLAVVASASTTALWRRNGAVQESQSQHEVRRSAAARSIRTSESGNPQSSPHVQSTRQLPPFSSGSYAPASSPAQAARGEPPPAAAQATGRQPALSTAASTGSFIPASQGAGSFTAPSGASVPQSASSGTPGPPPAVGVQRSGSHTPLGTPSGTTPSPLSRTQPTASAQPPHARLIRRG